MTDHATRPTSGPAATSRRQRRGADNVDDRRTKIIKGATELFASKGFTRTSVEDVMSILGISGPAFYYYFDSKPDVLAAMLDEAMTRAEEAIESLEDDQTLQPVERAIAAVVAHAGVILSSQDVARVLFTESRELPPEVATAIRGRMRAHSARITELVAAACGKDPMSLEMSGVTGLLLGMANWIAFLPSGSREWETIVDAYLPVLVACVLERMSEESL